MTRVIYLLNVSLDGYIETADRSLDWTHVDDELHEWFNEQSRTTDAFVYGRRLYEVMSAYWPNYEDDPEATEAMREYGRIWNPKPKIVFSTTLREVDPTSRLVSGDVGDVLDSIAPEFDGELSVAGPTLAAQFIERGLVDEYRLVIHPIILGSGTRFFPTLSHPIPLRLRETRTFASGVVYVAYASAAPDARSRTDLPRS